jgi:hypothetical protein
LLPSIPSRLPFSLPITVYKSSPDHAYHFH